MLDDIVGLDPEEIDHGLAIIRTLVAVPDK